MQEAKKLENLKKIPSFDLTENYKSVKDEINEAVQRVLDSQHFIMGPDVELFEKDMAAYLGVAACAACASGTDALVLALMSLKLSPQDEVITTPYTFFATASSITRTGARPVFVDIDAQSYNMSPQAAADALTPRTKAVMPVHLFGQMSPWDAGLLKFFKNKGVTVVEDCAQAIGSVYKDDGRVVRAGAMGDISCFSFFPTKNLGCYGDGGMVASNDEALLKSVKKLRLHGADVTYHHDEVGINSRLDTLQAAILRVRLRHLEEWNEKRIEVAARYMELFKQLNLIGDITPPFEVQGARHVYHQYVIRAQKRDALMAHLAELGITTRIYYPICLHLQPCFKYLGYKEGDFPVAEKLSKEALALPMYPELNDEQIIRIVEGIKNFYK